MNNPVDECKHDMKIENADKDGSQTVKCSKCGYTRTYSLFPRRRTVIVIENDVIGDEIWNPLFVKTLREYADYCERKMGGGFFPQCFRSSSGDKLTVYSGTYCEELPLGEGSPQQS